MNADEKWRKAYIQAADALELLATKAHELSQGEFKEDCLHYLDEAQDKLEMAGLAREAAKEAAHGE